MKFALVDGERSEAQPGLLGTCPTCERATVAKCGEVKIWHWAHQGKRTCDPWWENETEWHRAWKAEFPVSWQEIVHKAENGEKHIADVKTNHDWVIELQHSYIKPEERRSRNGFYQKLVWVVDGARRKRDSEQFWRVLNKGMPINGNPNLRRVSLDECSLLQEWGDTGAPVFFDFGAGPTLWWLFGKGSEGRAYVAAFSRSEFIGIHRGGATTMTDEFSKLVIDIEILAANFELNLSAQTSRQATPHLFQQLPRNRPRRL